MMAGDVTVTVNEQLLLCPQVSLEKHDTVVMPIGNVLPDGGLQLMDGGGLQPPLADAA